MRRVHAKAAHATYLQNQMALFSFLKTCLDWKLPLSRFPFQCAWRDLRYWRQQKNCPSNAEWERLMLLPCLRKACRYLDWAARPGQRRWLDNAASPQLFRRLLHTLAMRNC